MEQVESQQTQQYGLRPRTGIPEGGLSSEPVKPAEGVIGKIRKFARRVLAGGTGERQTGKGF